MVRVFGVRGVFGVFALEHRRARWYVNRVDRDDEDAARRRRLASLRGRIGAYVVHARHDPRETTAKARQAFFDRFEREVDPDLVLAPEERARRAEAARKAYFARLALASAKARARRRNG